MLSDLDDCLTVANTCLDKPYLYGFGKELYGRGLVTADGKLIANIELCYSYTLYLACIFMSFNVY